MSLLTIILAYDLFHLFPFFLLAKEPVRCNGRENITHALNPTTITQDHNRSISFIFARYHICVAAYPLLGRDIANMPKRCNGEKQLDYVRMR